VSDRYESGEAFQLGILKLGLLGKVAREGGVKMLLYWGALAPPSPKFFVKSVNAYGKIDKAYV